MPVRDRSHRAPANRLSSTKVQFRLFTAVYLDATRVLQHLTFYLLPCISLQIKLSLTYHYQRNITDNSSFFVTAIGEKF